MLQNLFYVFCICVAIQLIKLLTEFFVFVINRKVKKQEGKLPGVSVIVCAKNEEQTLPMVIESLFKQDYPDIEIIVVDDRSSDGTYDLLLTYGEKIKLVRIDQTPNHINNKKYAITLGVRAASNDKLLFIDADCFPSSHRWVSSMMTRFQSTFVLGFSQYVKEKGLLNAFIRFETLMSGMQYLTFAKLGNPYMGVGRNLGYTQALFIKEKGFFGYNDVMGGDDDLFVNKHANKNNTKVNISPDGLVYSFPKKTFSTYFRQKKRHIAVSKLYKAKDKFILGILSMSHILFWGSLIALVIYNYNPVILAGIYFGRNFLLIINAHLASLRLGDRINVVLIPIFDFLYTVYLLTVGTTAMFAKKITWT